MIVSKRFFSLFLAAVYAASNVVLAHAAEGRFWEERRKAARDAARSSSQDLLARIPAPAPLGASASLPFTSVRTLPASARGLPEPIRRALSASGPFASLREVHPPSRAGAPVFLLIQDLHGAPEAQRHVAGLLGRWSAEGPVWAGLEGARGAFDFAPHRELAGDPGRRWLADYFLEKDVLGGAEAAALAEENPPVLWGVETPDLYLAHAQSLREGLKARPAAQAELSRISADLSRRKAAHFSEALKSLDRAVAAYHAGGPLGAYARVLAAGAGSPYPNLRRFVRALDAEESLDFKAVDRDRAVLVGRLSERLAPADLQRVAAESLRLRQGETTPSPFYAFLRSLCRANGVPVDDLPAFNAYVRYLEEAEGIDRTALLSELALRERSAADALARTPAERELVVQSRSAALLDKLAAHAMSPEDWAEYGSVRKEALSLGDGLSSRMKPFEDFCRLALERDAALAENAWSQAPRRGLAVLVAGGFHTDGLSRALRAKGAGVAVLTPRISRLPETNYADLFDRQPLPLEKLFAGRPVFLLRQRVSSKQGMGPDGGDPRAAFQQACAMMGTSTRVLREKWPTLPASSLSAAGGLDALGSFAANFSAQGANAEARYTLAGTQKDETRSIDVVALPGAGRAPPAGRGEPAESVSLGALENGVTLLFYPVMTFFDRIPGLRGRRTLALAAALALTVFIEELVMQKASGAMGLWLSGAAFLVPHLWYSWRRAKRDARAAGTPWEALSDFRFRAFLQIFGVVSFQVARAFFDFSGGFGAHLVFDAGLLILSPWFPDALLVLSRGEAAGRRRASNRLLNVLRDPRHKLLSTPLNALTPRRLPSLAAEVRESQNGDPKAWASDFRSHDGSFRPFNDGRFRVTGLLQETGDTVVFDAEDTATGRGAVLKGVRLESGLFPSFAKEGLLLSDVIRPSGRTPKLLEMGVVRYRASVYFFMATERLPGVTLWNASRGGTDEKALTSLQEVRAVQSIFESVAGLHDQGVVHGDLKPENMILDQNLDVSSVDFEFGHKESLPGEEFPLPINHGTVGFAAPETVMKGVLSRSTDLYSAAASAVFFLTGKIPIGDDITDFRDLDAYERMLKERECRPVQELRKADGQSPLPADLAVILDSMLRRDPDQRAYKSAADVAAALGELLRRYADWEAEAAVGVLEDTLGAGKELDDPSLERVKAVLLEAKDAGASAPEALLWIKALKGNLSARKELDRRRAKPAGRTIAAPPAEGAGTLSPPPAASAQEQTLLDSVREEEKERTEYLARRQRELQGEPPLDAGRERINRMIGVLREPLFQLMQRTRGNWVASTHAPLYEAISRNWNTVAIEWSNEDPVFVNGKYRSIQTVRKNGNVYNAVDRGERNVVVKMASLDSEAGDEILQEAALYGGEGRGMVNAPALLDLGLARDDGGTKYVFIVLDRLGSTLWSIRWGNRLNTPAEETAILRSLARSLAELHDRGIVHGDIKPDNAVLDGPHRVSLIDYGQAFLLPPGVELLVTPEQTGTVGFASPEAFLEGKISRLSDLYSFAESSVCFLTGKLSSGLAGAHWPSKEQYRRFLWEKKVVPVQELREDAGASPLPDAVAEVLDALRERDPSRRKYRNAWEVYEALEGDPWRYLSRDAAVAVAILDEARADGRDLDAAARANVLEALRRAEKAGVLSPDAFLWLKAIVDDSDASEAEDELERLRRRRLEKVRSLSLDGEPPWYQAGVGGKAQARVSSELLGEGGIGQVYEARVGRRPVAVKRALSEAPDVNEMVNRGYEHQSVLQNLHHGVERAYGIGLKRGRVAVVKEIARGGDLARRPEKKGLNLSWPAAFLFFRRQASVLAALHAAGHLHNDAQGGNWLLLAPETSDRDWAWAVLADFDVSDSIAAAKNDNRIIGTIYYSAPEVLSKGLRSEVSDVYSQTSVAFEALTGLLPWNKDKKEFTVNDAAEILRRKEAPPGDPFEGTGISDVPQQFARLLMKQLDADPAERNTAAEIVAALDEMAPSLLSSEDLALLEEVRTREKEWADSFERRRLEMLGKSPAPPNVVPAASPELKEKILKSWFGPGRLAPLRRWFAGLWMGIDASGMESLRTAAAARDQTEYIEQHAPRIETSVWSVKYVLLVLLGPFVLLTMSLDKVALPGWSFAATAVLWPLLVYLWQNQSLAQGFHSLVHVFEDGKWAGPRESTPEQRGQVFRAALRFHLPVLALGLIESAAMMLLVSIGVDPSPASHRLAVLAPLTVLLTPFLGYLFVLFRDAAVFDHGFYNQVTARVPGGVAASAPILPMSFQAEALDQLIGVLRDPRWNLIRMTTKELMDGNRMQPLHKAVIDVVHHRPNWGDGLVPFNDGRFDVTKRLRGDDPYKGVVYAAKDLSTGRDVILKIAGLGSAVGSRYLRECALYGGELRGMDGAPELLGAGLAMAGEDTLFYTVLGQMKGMTVQEMVDRARAGRGRAFTEAQETSLVRSMFEVLTKVEERGLVHGDVTPGNVFFDGLRASLIDFEYTYLLSPGGKVQIGRREWGVVGFASPEFFLRGTLTTKSDLYSAAATAVHLLTKGRSPLSGWIDSEDREGYAKALKKDPVPVQVLRKKAGLPPLPAGLAAVLDSLLQSDPKNRGYQNAREVLKALPGRPSASAAARADAFDLLKRVDGKPFDFSGYADPRDVRDLPEKDPSLAERLGIRDVVVPFSGAFGDRDISLRLAGDFPAGYRTGGEWAELLSEALEAEGFGLDSLADALPGGRLTVVLADEDTHYAGNCTRDGIVTLHRKIFEDAIVTAGVPGAAARAIILSSLAHELGGHEIPGKGEEAHGPERRRRDLNNLRRFAGDAVTTVARFLFLHVEDGGPSEWLLSEKDDEPELPIPSRRNPLFIQRDENLRIFEAIKKSTRILKMNKLGDLVPPEGTIKRRPSDLELDLAGLPQAEPNLEIIYSEDASGMVTFKYSRGKMNENDVRIRSIRAMEDYLNVAAAPAPGDAQEKATPRMPDGYPIEPAVEDSNGPRTAPGDPTSKDLALLRAGEEQEAQADEEQLPPTVRKSDIVALVGNGAVNSSKRGGMDRFDLLKRVLGRPFHFKGIRDPREVRDLPEKDSSKARDLGIRDLAMEDGLSLRLAGDFPEGYRTDGEWGALLIQALEREGHDLKTLAKSLPGGRLTVILADEYTHYAGNCTRDGIVVLHGRLFGDAKAAERTAAAAARAIILSSLAHELGGHEIPGAGEEAHTEARREKDLGNLRHFAGTSLGGVKKVLAAHVEGGESLAETLAPSDWSALAPLYAKESHILPSVRDSFIEFLRNLRNRDSRSEQAVLRELLPFLCRILAKNGDTAPDLLKKAFNKKVEDYEKHLLETILRAKGVDVSVADRPVVESLRRRMEAKGIDPSKYPASFPALFPLLDGPDWLWDEALSWSAPRLPSALLCADLALPLARAAKDRASFVRWAGAVLPLVGQTQKPRVRDAVLDAVRSAALKAAADPEELPALERLLEVLPDSVLEAKGDPARLETGKTARLVLAARGVDLAGVSVETVHPTHVYTRRMLARVEGGDAGSLFLKEHREDPSLLECQYAVQNHLARKYFPTPRVRPAPGGGWVTPLGGRSYAVMSDVDGIQGEWGPSRRQRAEAARLAAQMHSHLAGFTLPGAPNQSNLYDEFEANARAVAAFLHELSERGPPRNDVERFLLEESAFILRQFEEAARDFPRSAYDAIPKNVIHGDFAPVNTVVEGRDPRAGRILSVIDFRPVSDIRPRDFIAGYETPLAGGSVASSLAFFTAYYQTEAERLGTPLSEEEVRRIPDVYRISRLRLLSWLAGSPDKVQALAQVAAEGETGEFGWYRGLVEELKREFDSEAARWEWASFPEEVRRRTGFIEPLLRFSHEIMNKATRMSLTAQHLPAHYPALTNLDGYGQFVRSLEPLLQNIEMLRAGVADASLSEGHLDGLKPTERILRSVVANLRRFLRPSPRVLGEDERQDLTAVMDLADFLRRGIESFRLDGGHFSTEGRPEVFDASRAAARVMGYCPSLEVSRKAVEFRPGPEGVFLIRMDPYLFSVILHNLFRNARDADPSLPTAETPVLSLSVDRAGDEVKVAFQDAGPGMPADILRQISGGFSTKGEGRGNGLKLVREIVEKAGGTLEIISRTAGGETSRVLWGRGKPSVEPASEGAFPAEKTSGTRFILSFPAAPAPPGRGRPGPRGSLLTMLPQGSAAGRSALSPTGKVFHVGNETQLVSFAKGHPLSGGKILIEKRDRFFKLSYHREIDGKWVSTHGEVSPWGRGAVLTEDGVFQKAALGRAPLLGVLWHDDGHLLLSAPGAKLIMEPLASSSIVRANASLLEPILRRPGRRAGVARGGLTVLVDLSQSDGRIHKVLMQTGAKLRGGRAALGFKIFPFMPGPFMRLDHSERGGENRMVEAVLFETGRRLAKRLEAPLEPWAVEPEEVTLTLDALDALADRGEEGVSDWARKVVRGDPDTLHHRAVSSFLFADDWSPFSAGILPDPEITRENKDFLLRLKPGTQLPLHVVMDHRGRLLMAVSSAELLVRDADRQDKIEQVGLAQQLTFHRAGDRVEMFFTRRPASRAAAVQAADLKAFVASSSWNRKLRLLPPALEQSGSMRWLKDSFFAGITWDAYVRTKAWKAEGLLSLVLGALSGLHAWAVLGGTGADAVWFAHGAMWAWFLFGHVMDLSADSHMERRAAWGRLSAALGLSLLAGALPFLAFLSPAGAALWPWLFLVEGLSFPAHWLLNNRDRIPFLWNRWRLMRVYARLRGASGSLDASAVLLEAVRRRYTLTAQSWVRLHKGVLTRAALFDEFQRRSNEMLTLPVDRGRAAMERWTFLMVAGRATEAEAQISAMARRLRGVPVDVSESDVLWDATLLPALEDLRSLLSKQDRGGTSSPAGLAAGGWERPSPGGPALLASARGDSIVEDILAPALDAFDAVELFSSLKALSPRLGRQMWRDLAGRWIGLLAGRPKEAVASLRRAAGTYQKFKVLSRLLGWRLGKPMEDLKGETPLGRVQALFAGRAVPVRVRTIVEEAQKSRAPAEDAVVAFRRKKHGAPDVMDILAGSKAWDELSRSEDLLARLFTHEYAEVFLGLTHEEVLDAELDVWKGLPRLNGETLDDYVDRLLARAREYKELRKFSLPANGAPVPARAGNGGNRGPALPRPGVEVPAPALLHLGSIYPDQSSTVGNDGLMQPVKRSNGSFNALLRTRPGRVAAPAQEGHSLREYLARVPQRLGDLGSIVDALDHGADEDLQSIFAVHGKLAVTLWLGGIKAEPPPSMSVLDLFKVLRSAGVLRVSKASVGPEMTAMLARLNTHGIEGEVVVLDEPPAMPGAGPLAAAWGREAGNTKDRVLILMDKKAARPEEAARLAVGEAARLLGVTPDLRAVKRRPGEKIPSYVDGLVAALREAPKREYTVRAVRQALEDARENLSPPKVPALRPEVLKALEANGSRRGLNAFDSLQLTASSAEFSKDLPPAALFRAVIGNPLPFREEAFEQAASRFRFLGDASPAEEQSIPWESLAADPPAFRGWLLAGAGRRILVTRAFWKEAQVAVLDPGLYSRRILPLAAVFHDLGWYLTGPARNGLEEDARFLANLGSALFLEGMKAPDAAERLDAFWRDSYDRPRRSLATSLRAADVLDPLRYEPGSARVYDVTVLLTGENEGEASEDLLRALLQEARQENDDPVVLVANVDMADEDLRSALLERHSSLWELASKRLIPAARTVRVFHGGAPMVSLSAVVSLLKDDGIEASAPDVITTDRRHLLADAASRILELKGFGLLQDVSALMGLAAFRFAQVAA